MCSVQQTIKPAPWLVCLHECWIEPASTMPAVWLPAKHSTCLTQMQSHIPDTSTFKLETSGHPAMLLSLMLVLQASAALNYSRLMSSGTPPHWATATWLT